MEISTVSPASNPPSQSTPPDPKSPPRRDLDFVNIYTMYADILELHPSAHSAVAMQLIAATLNEKVQIKYGALESTLDLWIGLLSPSGGGRNTLLRTARKILNLAGLDSLLIGAEWGSKQALQQQIAEKPKGLFLWPEMSVALKKLSEAQFSGAKEWLTNCYDEDSIPQAIVYRKTNKATDTPEIVFQKAPRLNILATSSLAWFTANLKLEDTTGGFLPRWTIIKLPATGRSIPKPKGANHQEAERWLAQRLQEVANLKGTADFSEVEELYGDWYGATQARMCSHLADSGARRSRFRNHPGQHSEMMPVTIPG